MMKSCMEGARIDHVGQTQLHDSTQTLKKGMFDYFKDQLARYRNEAVKRVVDYFIFVSQRGTGIIAC